MLVVTKVEYFETDKNITQIMHLRPEEPFLARENGTGRITPIDKELARETVTGRRYVNSRGLDIVIGITADTRNALGLEFEVLGNLENENSKLRDEVSNLNRKSRDLNEEIENLKQMTLFNRLKFLFGVKYT